jgi:hypothetical protein
MSERQPTRRRWFQFGLASMFVFVMAAAVALSWLMRELRISHARDAMRERLRARNATIIEYEGSHARNRFPGDRLVAQIHVYGFKPEEEDEIHSVFPEAAIWSRPK